MGYWRIMEAHFFDLGSSCRKINMHSLQIQMYTENYTLYWKCHQKKIEIITTGKLFLTMVHHDLNKFPQLVLENALLQVLPRFVV